VRKNSEELGRQNLNASWRAAIRRGCAMRGFGSAEAEGIAAGRGMSAILKAHRISASMSERPSCTTS
jgi:hypothetical protein